MTSGYLSLSQERGRLPTGTPFLEARPSAWGWPGDDGPTGQPAGTGAPDAHGAPWLSL